MKRWLLSGALAAPLSIALGSFAGFAAEAAAVETVDQLSVRKLAAGQGLTIATHSRVYKGRVVDPKTGEMELALSRDGASFSEPVRLFVLGATAGAQPDTDQMLVRMGKVRVGERMELGIGSRDLVDRALSDPVLDIRLDGSAGSFAGSER